MRLFMAAFPTDEFLTEVRGVIRQLDKIKRNFRFIPYDQLHLTLKFIGAKVSFDSFEEISSKFSQFSYNAKKPVVEVDRLQFGFPGQQYPNVIFFTLEPDPGLDTLVDDAHEMIKDLDLPDTIRRKDRKRHINHITVARSKRSTSKSLTRNTRNTINKIELPEMKFEIDRISLMESVLTPTGPTYKKISSINL